MSWLHVLAGAAVVLALEGIAYAAFPSVMARAAAGIAGADPGRLRAGGLVAAALGTGVAWLLMGV